MTKKYSTKRALVASILALCMCFTMLIGTTFAWFTDSVTSSGNVIQSGTLEVKMYYADGKLAVPADDSDKWVNADGKAIYTANQLWEPGYTDAKHIKISNEGTLALKYQLAIIPTGEVSELAEVIDVYLYHTDGVLANAAQVADRTAINEDMKVGTLADVISKGIVQGNLEANTDYTTTIVFKMRENVGNDYQNLSIGDDFTIQLLATQYTSENDSFGPDYDADAWHPEMKIYSADDLLDALSNGATDIVLSNDITLTGTLTIPAAAATLSMRSAPATVKVNLGGHTLKADKVTAEGAALITNGTLDLPESGRVTSYGEGVSITVENVVIVSDQISAYVCDKGTMTLKNVVFKNTATSNPIQNYGGNLTMENVTVAQDGDANTPWYSSAVQVINLIQQNESGKWETLTQANTVINSGLYEGKKAIMISAPGGNVTINGGTFRGSEYALQADFYPNNYVNGSNFESKVIINGGTFEGALKASSAVKLEIYGGTFTADPSAYVVDGFKAVKSGDLYYVVADGIDNVISTADELVAAFANLEAGDVLYIAADIDMTGKTITPVTSNKGFTMYGNGNTISNLNSDSAALFVAHSGSSPYTFDNVVLENCSVKSTTNYGALFVGDGDTSDAITITNCVVKNCTVESAKYAAAFVAYTAGYNVQNNGPVYSDVLVENCSVIGGSITGGGSVGAAIGHSGGNDDTTTTVTNLTVDGVAINGEDAEHTGIVVGTAHVGDTIINGTTYVNVTGNYNGLYGRFLPGTTGTLVIDGAKVLPAANTEAFKNAVAGGTTEVYLPAGDYAMLNSGLEGKTLAIKGTKDTVIDATAISENNQFVTNATIVFDGVTINFGTNNYMGFANTKSLTYKNCTINGLQFLYGENVTFENCVFNSNGAEHSVWTYGAQNVSFIGCSFTYADRAINVYGVGRSSVTLSFDGCIFATENTASKGAVEINSSAFPQGANVSFVDCIAPAYGTMVGISGWDGTDGATANITVDGTAFTATKWSK